MNVYLGNIQFNQVKSKLGYTLTDNDKNIWNKYHSQLADLSDKESCFHVFDIPRCIVYKGEEAKKAILQIFSPEKLTNPCGRFQVYEQV